MVDNPVDFPDKFVLLRVLFLRQFVLQLIKQGEIDVLQIIDDFKRIQGRRLPILFETELIAFLNLVDHVLQSYR
ncbi:hypothetical protein D3C76_1421760 [compost metagenome]